MKSKKLHVAMVCKNLPWNFQGGIQSHTWDLCRELVNEGYQISIICGANRHYPKAYFKEGVQIIPVRYFPGRFLKPIGVFAEEFLFNLAVKKWLLRNEPAFDLVHLQGRSGYLYSIARRNLPVVQTVHGLINEENKGKGRNIGLTFLKIITSFFEKMQISRSDKLIAVSEDLADLISQKFKLPKTFDTIPNGVHLGKIENELKTFRKVLFVGRLSSVKNPFLLVDILKELPDDVTLTVIGDGELKKELIEKFENSDLGSRVQFLGSKSRSEIYENIQKSDLLILPSNSETQGIVLLEANANAKPVVATNLNSIQESITQGFNGLLCQKNNASSFANAIKILLDDESLRFKMGLNGLEKVRREFDWKILTRKTIRVYNSIQNA